MARPSKRSRDYESTIERMKWRQLRELWKGILQNDTPAFEPGKALEYLVIRAFRLSRVTAEYSFDVPPGGRPLEQIDGLLELDGVKFLVECKDQDVVDIVAIAKLRNQLLRRPDTTLGCIFVEGQFSPPALTLADFSTPQRILLWPDADIERCLQEEDFCTTLKNKYHHLCKYGLTDLSPHVQELQET